MKKLIFMLVIGVALVTGVLTLTWMPLEASAEFKEGKDYRRLSTPVPTATGDKIEVVEIFWYGCPHCFHLESKINGWVTNKPENVAFMRLPADLGRQVGRTHARAFYTAEALGVLDKIHEPLMQAIHVKKQPLNTKAQLAQFFAEQGVDKKDFEEAFNSFQVDTEVRRSQKLVRSYRVGSVPTIVVNGKYIVDSALAGSPDKIFEVVNYLIDKEAGTS